MLKKYLALEFKRNELLSSELSSCNDSISSINSLNADLNAKLEKVNLASSSVCLIVITSYVFICTLFCACTTWIDDSFIGTGHYTQVNLVLGNLVRLHWCGLMTLPSGESVPATTWEHYRYGVCRTFGNTQALVWDAFWV
jgi:hypothetical protein